MTNPNAGQKIQRRKTTEKIIERATRVAESAILPSTRNTKQAPKTAALSKSELKRKQKNVKAAIIYFDLDVFEELQAKRRDGMVISRLVNITMRKELGLM